MSRYVATLLVFLCCGFIIPVLDGADKKMNVVMIVADDLGQQLGCYGDPVVKTPNIDRLAAEGIRCTRAYCTTASCSPSRSVILSGLHNHANGQLGLAHNVHHFAGYESVRSLPLLMTSAGYRTCRIGKLHVAPEYVAKFEFARDIGIQGARNPIQMAKNAKEWIEEKDSRPFFLYFCPTDPHRGPGPVDYANHHEQPDFYSGVTAEIYDPANIRVPEWLPDRPEVRRDLAEYYQSISRFDAGIGALIQSLHETNHWDDTLILLLSDNGPPIPGAKTTLYEPGIHLPLIVRDPALSRRGTCDALITWADLVPTILEICQIPVPSGVTVQAVENQGHESAKATKAKTPYGFHGRSFLKDLADEHPGNPRDIFFSHTFHEVTMYYPMRAVRSGRYKLIWNIAHPLPFPFAQDLYQSAVWQETLKRKAPDELYGLRSVKTFLQRPEFELYDLEADPGERTNLATSVEHSATLKSLQEKLRKFQKETEDPWLSKWEYE